jgi:hypothetical protein
MTDEQNEPRMAGSTDANVTEKVEGLIAQVKADAPGVPEAELETLLRQRLDDAGLELDDAEITRLARWEAGES